MLEASCVLVAANLCCQWKDLLPRFDMLDTIFGTTTPFMDNFLFQLVRGGRSFDNMTALPEENLAFANQQSWYPIDPTDGEYVHEMINDYPIYRRNDLAR